MSKPFITTSRNSSTLITGKYEFNYSPDRTDELTGDWLLIVKKNGKEVASYTNSELLEVANGEGPVDLLLAGVGLYLMNK